MFTLNNQSSYNVVNNLTRLGAELAISNQRLSTGKRVNSGADDPSGVVAIANLENQIAQIDAMSQNGQKISSIIDTADGAMSQISALLGTIQSKALAAAGSSATAYQAEIDTAIDAIDTLVNTTSYNGTRLLDGGLAYTTSGVDNTKLSDVRVNSADTSGGSISLQVSMDAVAEKAVISYSGGDLSDDVTFTLTGENGAVEFSFTTGSSKTDIATGVNLQSDATGVEAEVDGGVLYFRSTNYGSSEDVSISVSAGTFVMDGGTTSDSGVDVTVTVGGQATTADGMQVFYSNGTNSARFTLEESYGTGAPGATTTFSITGGGAGWQLDPNPINKIHFGMSSLSSSFIGNDSLGYLSTLKSGGANAISSGNYQQAANIAAAASQQVATDRARMGAVKNYTIDATLSSLSTTKNALTNAVSNIEDVDYVAETANNQRLNALYQMNVYVMNSLQQNQSNILSLFQQLL